MKWAIQQINKSWAIYHRNNQISWVWGAYLNDIISTWQSNVNQQDDCFRPTSWPTNSVLAQKKSQYGNEMLDNHWSLVLDEIESLNLIKNWFICLLFWSWYKPWKLYKAPNFFWSSDMTSVFLSCGLKTWMNLQYCDPTAQICSIVFFEFALSTSTWWQTQSKPGNAMIWTLPDSRRGGKNGEWSAANINNVWMTNVLFVLCPVTCSWCHVFIFQHLQSVGHMSAYSWQPCVFFV